MRDKIILYRSRFRDRPSSDSESDSDEKMQGLSPSPRPTQRARQDSEENEQSLLEDMQSMSLQSPMQQKSVTDNRAKHERMANLKIDTMVREYSKKNKTYKIYQHRNFPIIIFSLQNTDGNYENTIYNYSSGKEEMEVVESLHDINDFSNYILREESTKKESQGSSSTNTGARRRMFFDDGYDLDS